MPQKIHGGYYIKARRIKDSGIAHAPPCVREIWDYLLREACHKDVKYAGFKMERGQLFKSYREIRDDLSWHVGYRKERYSENQMKKGMKYLMKELMISTMKEPRGVLITIHNYDYFQNPKNYEGTNEGTNEGTKKEPRRNRNGPSINKNDKNDKKKREGGNGFKPPKLDEVVAYCKKRKNNINPKVFIDWNQSKGWMIGKNKMKDWEAAIRTWEQRNKDEILKNQVDEIPYHDPKYNTAGRTD